MRVLLTNDDGVRAEGIAVMAAALIGAGHELTIVAPLRDVSGAGTGTGPQRRGVTEDIEYEAVHLESVPSLVAHGVDALPGLCVAIGCAEAFGPAPQMVVSGINRGRNVGRSVLHSGTVGAALTAAQSDCSALAVSIQSRGGVVHFETAAALGLVLLDELAQLPPATVLNCNSPNVVPSELAGLRVARIGRTAILTETVVEGSRIRLRFSMNERGEPNSDEALTAAGFATVTALATGYESPDQSARSAVESAVSRAGSEFEAIALSSATSPPQDSSKTTLR